MTFKDAELADRDGVFLDLDEFGAEVSIDGTTVTAVVDEVEFGDRDLAMGLPSSGMRVFAKTENMPQRRMPGETVLVNGRSCGRRRLKKFRALFRVRYEPGTLTAVVYDRAGKELGRSELVSATGAVRLDVRPEVSCVRVGEIAYVAIELRGENDVLESNADRRVTLEVEGGELLGFGSAQPNPEESYLSSECQTWYGRAVAVVGASERGQVAITARDATGQVASAAIDVE